MATVKPARGEIWTVDLNPTRGHEPAGIRPCLVISANRFNVSGAELIIVIPVTTTIRNVPSHVRVTPPEAGLTSESAIRCENVRSVSKERLSKLWGAVSPATLRKVEGRLRILLDLP